jgi:hypothetical protein
VTETTVLREAAEKDFARLLEKAYEDVTGMRTELQKLQGVSDFSALGDEMLAQFKEGVANTSKHWPMSHLLFTIIAMTVTREEEP